MNRVKVYDQYKKSFRKLREGLERIEHENKEVLLSNLNKIEYFQGDTDPIEIDTNIDVVIKNYRDKRFGYVNGLNQIQEIQSEFNEFLQALSDAIKLTEYEIKKMIKNWKKYSDI